jgi:hypothetical protein
MGTVQWAGLKTPDFEIPTEKLLAPGAVIALAAGNSTVDYDFFTDFDMAHFAAGFDYSAGCVRTGDVR